MKPPRLELDHLARKRRYRWPGALLLAVSLGVCADLVLRYQEALEELSQARTAAAPAPASVAIAAAPASAVQEKIARAAVRQLALPWAGLIVALEGVSTRDVALLQLHPDAQHEIIRITADARDSAAMFRYLRNLAKKKGLSRVHLLRHEVVRDDPQQPVRFSAQASFRGMQ